jgi:hypothetical protein
LLILAISAIFILLQNRKKFIVVFFIFTILFLILKFYQTNNSYIFAVRQIASKKLIFQIIANKKFIEKGKIIFLDNKGESSPLTDYYFKGFGVFDRNESDRIRNYFSNKSQKQIKAIREIEYMQDIKDKDIITFIIFNESDEYYSDLKLILNKYLTFKKIKITSFYFRLKCNGNICNFYQDY